MAVTILTDGPHGPIRPEWMAPCGEPWPCEHFRAWVLSRVELPTIRRLLMQHFWFDAISDLGPDPDPVLRDELWLRIFGWLPRVPEKRTAPPLPVRPTTTGKTLGPPAGYRRISIAQRGF